jgi:hypothetical protein
MKRQEFYVELFTRAGSDAAAAIARAEAIIQGISGLLPSVSREPYDKLGLYAEKVTLNVVGETPTMVRVFDAFLALASTGWASFEIEEDYVMREAAWDCRRSRETFLDTSVRAAFVGVEDPWSLDEAAPEG